MKIILGTFKDNANELAEFLGPRLGDTPSVSGGEIDFDDEKVKKTIRSRHVKTYIKRYLNRKGERANYQVLVEGKELRLIEIEREEEEEKEKEKKARAKTEETKVEERKEAEPALPEPQEGKEEAGEATAEEEKEKEPAKPKKKASKAKPSDSPSSSDDA